MFLTCNLLKICVTADSNVNNNEFWYIKVNENRLLGILYAIKITPKYSGTMYTHCLGSHDNCLVSLDRTKTAGQKVKRLQFTFNDGLSGHNHITLSHQPFPHLVRRLHVIQGNCHVGMQ